MRPKVAIIRASALWRAAPGIERLARRAIGASVEATAAPILEGAEVSVQLADDAQVRALNGRWRGFDKATNVLSFPAVAPARIATAPLLGDIVIAFETVQREAAEEHKTVADHTVHLVVHGFLHLLGYDHQDAAEAERMEALETTILTRLDIADPYAVADATGAPA